MAEEERSLSPKVVAAIERLRELPDARPEWRAEVLHRVASPDLRGAGGDRRRWTVRPFTAVAAGILCALVGAGVTAVAMSHRGAGVPELAATAPANAGPLPVRFTLIAPRAVRVSIVGDFNRWDPAALPLRRSADGRTWEVEVALRPGRYSYSFVVDGRLARDPSAPEDGTDDFGSPNSILMVRGS
jgi:Carbohydrate-binding module 48 (Isoamylase N-terminal domain)